MKLRNKKTGEIVRVEFLNNWQTDDGTEIGFRECNTRVVYSYDSLTELNADWEDAPEEPKEHYFITEYEGLNNVANIEDYKQIDNYFETEEEAEKAVEKLKAWKRLKDKGLKFLSYFDSSVDAGRIYADFPKEKSSGEVHKDLDLLFGGEDE